MPKGPKPRPLIERILDRVEIASDGCWMWTGYIMPNGYAKLTVPNRSNLVHRTLYEELVGPIPPGYDLDHTCHNADPDCPGGWACRHRACVNPEHQRPATRTRNLAASPQVARNREILAERQRLTKRATVRRMSNGDKTHCPKGHPYDEANTRWYRGGRRCRTCDREQHNARYAARRGGDAR